MEADKFWPAGTFSHSGCLRADLPLLAQKPSVLQTSWSPAAVREQIQLWVVYSAVKTQGATFGYGPQLGGPVRTGFSCIEEQLSESSFRGGLQRYFILRSSKPVASACVNFKGGPAILGPGPFCSRGKIFELDLYGGQLLLEGIISWPRWRKSCGSAAAPHFGALCGLWEERLGLFDPAPRICLRWPYFAGPTGGDQPVISIEREEGDCTLFFWGTTWRTAPGTRLALFRLGERPAFGHQ